MVKEKFAIKAAEGYRGLDGENENNTGNAFDGTKESYDREMWNALDAVSMQGDEAVNPSSIANAQLRVASVFAEAGANKKGKAERGLSIEQMMLLENIRDLIAAIDQRIEVIQDSIDFLESIADDDPIMTAGSYDELSPADQERLDRYLKETGQTAEEHFMSTLEERIQKRDETIAENKAEINALEEVRADLITLEELQELVSSGNVQSIDADRIGVVNNAFVNEILESAAKKWEAENGELDRYNLNSEIMYDLLSIIDSEKTAETAALARLEATVNNDNPVNEQIAMGAGLNLQFS